MKQISILGAAGPLGRNLLQKAINNGFRVKVLVRRKEKLGELIKFVEVVDGNYFDKNKLQKVLEGSEAILSTIGPPLFTELSLEDENNYIKSLAFIIEQMDINKQSRWLNISDAGAKMDMEKLPLARKLLRLSLKAESKSTIHIKDRELQLLEQSPLDWTSIRSPRIMEKAKGRFCVDDTNFSGTVVDLNQLSDFMIAEMTKDKWLKKAPVVGTK